MECVILGILASESYQREKDWLEYGCNVFHERNENQSRPLSFWTDDDIWEYIKKYHVKIPELYKMGYSRNGCMYCGFGVHLEPRGDNRYQKLRKTHPVQYSYFIYNFGDLIIQCDVNAAQIWSGFEESITQAKKVFSQIHFQENAFFSFTFGYVFIYVRSGQCFLFINNTTVYPAVPFHVICQSCIHQNMFYAMSSRK